MTAVAAAAESAARWTRTAARTIEVPFDRATTLKYSLDEGWLTRVGGFDVFVEEGGRVPPSQAVEGVERLIARIPETLRDGVRSVRLLAKPDPTDALLAEKFGPGFSVARASPEQQEITFWHGWYSDFDLTHEMSHLSGVAGGPPDVSAWKAAVAADQAVSSSWLENNQRKGREMSRWRGSWYEELVPRQGVTTYADSMISNGRGFNEDWAESVAHWAVGPHYLQEANPSWWRRQLGDTRRTAIFDELFPNRTQIIEAHYGQPARRAT